MFSKHGVRVGSYTWSLSERGQTSVTQTCKCAELIKGNTGYEDVKGTGHNPGTQGRLP